MSAKSSRSVFDELTDFLASSPTPEAILAYRLPADLEERARQLYTRQEEGSLSAEEAVEIYDFICVADIMKLLKAKIHLKLENKPGQSS
jgi:hypothetical protein